MILSIQNLKRTKQLTTKKWNFCKFNLNKKEISVKMRNETTIECFDQSNHLKENLLLVKKKQRSNSMNWKISSNKSALTFKWLLTNKLFKKKEKFISYQKTAKNLNFKSNYVTLISERKMKFFEKILLLLSKREKN